MKKLFLLLIALIVILTVVIVSCEKNTPVTGVTLNKPNLTLGVGETEMLIATVLPQKAVNKAVTWASSNVLVASVMPNGLVTALTKGTTTIVVTTIDGSYSASCTVKVDDILVTSVTLNKNTLILDIDETETLIATVLPENATNKEVYYSVTGVTLNLTQINLGVGTTEQLTAVVTPNNATNKNVSWNSSNPLIASVDDDGLVTAKGEGTADITATTEDGNFTAKCEVSCINFTSPVLTTLDKAIFT